MTRRFRSEREEAARSEVAEYNFKSRNGARSRKRWKRIAKRAVRRAIQVCE